MDKGQLQIKMNHNKTFPRVKETSLAEDDVDTKYAVPRR